MRFAYLLIATALVGCTSESDHAKQELETIRSAQANLSASRAVDNAQLCDAYRKLQTAYLHEGNRKMYEDQQLFVVAYCA